MSFGRSRARRVEAAEQPVTFDDVAGIDEAKEELTEIVDFLKNPGQVPAARRPDPARRAAQRRARAPARRCWPARWPARPGVPFFQMSASEFVEMIVGVGASRVRDLFQQAKAAAPAIIFIDELDAIGRSRAAGGPNISGGHDEREQTLNQILTEMDGFDPRSGVIVLGATNRPEILDPALLRPGRFDRRVVGAAPGPRRPRGDPARPHPLGAAGRRASTSARIAASTPGMVGADLANLVNEAALLAARRNHDKVARQDLTDALERIVLGAERKVMLTEEDRRRTAYHEAGHAIVGMLTPGADPVRKVSIIPRGQALGVTFSAPDADRFNFDERHLLAQIKVALGGRAAEEIVFGDLTTGAESDIQQLTRIARHMVGRWGMSRAIGPIAVLPRDGMGPLLPGVSETSEATQRLVDEEVRRIVETAHDEVTELLRSTAPTSTRWSRRCSSTRRSTRPTPTPPPGLPRNPLAAARAASRRSVAWSRVASPSYSGRRPAKPASGSCQKPISLLVEQPAEVDLLAVAERGEVDQPAVDVAQHDVDGLELADARG